jgi:hypothetical protein
MSVLCTLYCGAHTLLPRATQSRNSSGMEATHSPPFASWQRVSSNTKRAALLPSSRGA